MSTKVQVRLTQACLFQVYQVLEKKKRSDTFLTYFIQSAINGPAVLVKHLQSCSAVLRRRKEVYQKRPFCG